MRITRPFTKVLYVLAWLVLTLMATTALTVSGVSYSTAALVGDVMTIGFGIIGVRTFRGRGEDVPPARAWWRASGAATSSYVIGTTAVLAVALSVFGLIMSGAAFLLVAAVQFALTAAFYLHSGHRLAHTAPQRLHADFDLRESPRRATAG